MGFLTLPLWAFHTLYVDNAPVDTASISCLFVPFNEAPRTAYRAEQLAQPFFEMEIKGYDDFILALVPTRLNVLCCEWVEGKDQLDLIQHKTLKVNAQDFETKLGLPRHALRRAQKCVFTFSKSVWRTARAIHDEANPVPTGKLKPRIIRWCLGSRPVLHLWGLNRWLL